MASSIFYQFLVNKCVVDSELLDHFSGAGWKLKENEDSFFTKYEWPDIKLSKSIIGLLDEYQDYKFAIELLGCYQPKNDCTQEGTVILYYEKIKEAAEQYILETSSLESLESVIESFTSIVLLHELVHWLMHFVSPEVCNINPVRIRYKTFDELEFHEGFAQIFTHWFANNSGGLILDIFNWLSDNQPPQYRAHNKLIDIGVTSPTHAITLLSICKLLDIQSMDKAFKISGIYPCKDWATFEKLLFDPYKFQTFVSDLNFQGKKLLFKYLITLRWSGELSEYLILKKKEKRSVLRIITEILRNKNLICENPSFEEICDCLIYYKNGLIKDEQ